MGPRSNALAIAAVLGAASLAAPAPYTHYEQPPKAKRSKAQRRKANAARTARKTTRRSK